MTTDNIGMLCSVVVIAVLENFVAVIVEGIPVTEGIGSVRNHRNKTKKYKYLLIITETSG